MMNRMNPQSMEPQMDQMVQPGMGISPEFPQFDRPSAPQFSRPAQPFSAPEANPQHHPDMPEFEIDNEDPELNEAIMASLQMSQ